MNMKDNKLIAEFMGYEAKHGKCYSPKYNDGTIAPMQFDRSWDWLMPVVQKCRLESRCEYDEDDNWNEIHWALEECNLDKIYNAVVEFIKEYNVDNADSEDDACDMLYGVDNNQ